MLYYIHAHAADALVLRLCLDRLRALDPCARVIVANDPSSPILPPHLPQEQGVQVIRTPYPCGGNLNGRAMVEGMLSTLLKAMEDYGEVHIVKLDADVWLNAVDWLKVGRLTPEGTPEPDFLALEYATPFTASGGCYRISRYAARAALKGLRSRTWPQNYHMPEDATIFALVRQARLPVLTIPYTDGRYCGMHFSPPGKREREAWAVHCGEPCTDGSRAPRDFVLLRMRLMATSCYPVTTKGGSDVHP